MKDNCVYTLSTDWSMNVHADHTWLTSIQCNKITHNKAIHFRLHTWSAASMSGVYPSTVGMLMSSPFSIRRFNASNCPPSTANIAALHPFTLIVSIFSPALMASMIPSLWKLIINYECISLLLKWSCIVTIILTLFKDFYCPRQLFRKRRSNL